MDPHDLPSIKSEPLRFTLMTLTPPSLSLITSFLMQILFLYPDCSFLLLSFHSQSSSPAPCPQKPFLPHAVSSTPTHFRSKLSLPFFIWLFWGYSGGSLQCIGVTKSLTQLNTNLNSDSGISQSRKRHVSEPVGIILLFIDETSPWNWKKMT